MSSPSPIYPASIPAEIEDLKRRIRVLETSNQLLSAAIQGGALTIYDDAGNAVAKIGSSVGGTTMTNGTRQGVDIRDSNNRRHFEVTSDQGMVRPHSVHPWAPFPGLQDVNPALITNATFETVFWCTAIRIPSDSVSVHLLASADAGTVGEIRLTAGGGAVTSAHTVTNTGFVNIYIFNWKHGRDLHSSDIFRVQARRVSGAGNVNVYWPYSGAMFVGSSVYLATPTGV